jgi:putative ABC transport system permease protein
MDNLRAAFRALRATPGPTFVVIATLAIAIGANAAIFTVVNSVLLRPLYGDDDGLVVVWTTNGADDDNKSRLSPADYRDLRDGVEAFDGSVALYRSIGSTLTSAEQPVRVGSFVVTARLFRTLGTRPALGRLFTDADEIPGGPKRVVMTYASWTRRFGSDPDIIGKTIGLDNLPYVVVAVAEPSFQFPPGNTDTEFYFPMPLSDGVLLDRDHRMFDAIGRLADGVTLEAANAEAGAMAAQLAKQFPNTNEGWGITMRPLRAEMLGDLGPTLMVLAGAVFLVLLTACANIANVLVARSTASSREFAVRAAMGARPRDLLQRSLAESSILGLMGGAAGIALAFWGVSFLRSVMPAEIPRADSLAVDTTVLLVAVALSIGSTLLFGLLPAARSMSPQLHDLLKPAGASASGRAGGQRLRELMVVIEVGLAIVLLVGAGLMVRSFARLSEVDPGFRQDGVVSVAVRLPTTQYGRAEWRSFFEGIVERVRQSPGIDAAGAVSDLPMSEVGLGLELEFTVAGLDAVDPTAKPYANARFVIPGYLETIGMELIEGRGFDQLDASSERPVAVVNEMLADQYFPDYNPIGRLLQMDLVGEVEIIGVVADVHHGGVLSKYESEIFMPFGRIATAEMHVVAQSDLETAAVANTIRNVVADIDPGIAPASAAAMEDLLWESAAQPRFNTALLTGLALCAALLAVVGTYGIVAYSVSQRIGEIGVRMALGADAAATVALIVGQALRIVLVGASFGILGAFGAAGLLGELLFETRPTDPLTYVSVFVAAVVVGVLAAWMPARRATRVDPSSALRDG